MDGKNKLGVGLIAIGIFIAFMMLAADKIGLGDGDHGFGPKQKIGTLMGLAVAASGVVISIRRNS
jgi:hypothetical protein